MIYGRFGNPLTILRLGTIDDVQRLAGRKPDQRDRDAVASHSYLVCREEDGTESLYHQAYMRADGGSLEISKAMSELGIETEAP